MPLIHHAEDVVSIAVAHELPDKVLLPVPTVPSALFSVSVEIAIVRVVPEPVLIKLIIVPTGYATDPSIVIVPVAVLIRVFPASPSTVVYGKLAETSLIGDDAGPLNPEYPLSPQ